VLKIQILFFLCSALFLRKSSSILKKSVYPCPVKVSLSPFVAIAAQLSDVPGHCYNGVLEGF